ncbi:hypothetical protein [Ectothiorhodospira sp. BSL-9]|uniref:hypothetical protein n=1 Tax=Ectothiorhodospira sp. BSL-9 TaxID=1442136 RepID=UPI0012E89E7D|nr:hypothetical protein [Ectothiorhodospira sp. BSL-9]
MADLNWSDVQDRPDERMEFGANHVRCGWRPHRRLADKFKFLGLRSALHGSKHSLQQLLQEVGGNVNAKQHAERGEAIFAAVWFSDSEWAILCDATKAVIVPRATVDCIEECKTRNDAVTNLLREVLENTNTALVERFDDGLYQRICGA